MFWSWQSCDLRSTKHLHTIKIHCEVQLRLVLLQMVITVFYHFSYHMKVFGLTFITFQMQVLCLERVFLAQVIVS